MFNFCWDIVIAHALIRRTPCHPQSQMAWILLLHQWAELRGLEYSVYCSPVIFQYQVFEHVKITQRTMDANLCWYETLVCICQSHEDCWEKVLVTEKLWCTVICFPHPNVVSINSSYAVRKICLLLEFTCCVYPVIFVSSWLIGQFQTFPYCVTGISDNFTFSSSAQKVLIIKGNGTVTLCELPVNGILIQYWNWNQFEKLRKTI